MAVAARAKPDDSGGADSRTVRFTDELHRVVVDVIDLSRLDRWPEKRLRDEVKGLAKKLAPTVDRKLSSAQIDEASNTVVDEIFGLGPLEPLLRDSSITEILVNAPDKVYVERNGRLELTPYKFADKAHVVRVVQRIASRVGRRVDESSPMVDARLADGSRVNAVLQPLTLDSPVLSIRRFGHILTADDLVSRGSATPEILQFLEAVVASRINLLISGGGGAGKTTLLNVLSRFIPSTERLVTIEDAAELQLQQPHVVRMEARSANLEGQGLIAQRDLLRNALRMRPDRIILGEARGPEAIDMLQAMNTGHEGSITTVHANDTRDALNRLELMIGLCGVNLAVPVLRGYIAAAITVIVHVSRLAGGERKITRVSELVGLRKGKAYRVRDVFAFDQTDVVDGEAVGTYRATGYVPQVLVRLAAAGHAVPESIFAAGPLGGEVGEAFDTFDPLLGEDSGPDLTLLDAKEDDGPELFDPLLGDDVND